MGRRGFNKAGDLLAGLRLRSALGAPSPRVGRRLGQILSLLALVG